MLETHFLRLLTNDSTGGYSTERLHHMSDLTTTISTIAPVRAYELVEGETYDSWICASCENVIALGRRSPESDPRDLPDAVVIVICQRCQARLPYRMHDRRVRQYPWAAGSR